jgi:hypothetical protein
MTVTDDSRGAPPVLGVMKLSHRVLGIEAQHPFRVVMHRLVPVATVAQVLVGITVFIAATVGTRLARRSRGATPRGTVTRAGQADA